MRKWEGEEWRKNGWVLVLMSNDWGPIGVPTLGHLIKKPIQTNPELAGRFWGPKPFQIAEVDCPQSADKIKCQ